MVQTGKARGTSQIPSQKDRVRKENRKREVPGWGAREEAKIWPVNPLFGWDIFALFSHKELLQWLYFGSQSGMGGESGRVGKTGRRKWAGRRSKSWEERSSDRKGQPNLTDLRPLWIPVAKEATAPWGSKNQRKKGRSKLLYPILKKGWTSLPATHAMTLPWDTPCWGIF